MCQDKEDFLDAIPDAKESPADLRATKERFVMESDKPGDQKTSVERGWREFSSGLGEEVTDEDEFLQCLKRKIGVDRGFEDESIEALQEYLRTGVSVGQDQISGRFEAALTKARKVAERSR